MREISFIEYLKHFFTNVDAANNEILNTKDTLKVKELINLIDVVSNDGIVTIFEFNKILKFFNEFKYTYMSTGKEIEKVKKNLGININN